MPNIKSAKKRVNVNAKKRNENRMIKSELNTAIRNFRIAVSENKENINELYSNVVSLIDSVANKGIIHANSANNKKARLAKLMNKANA